MRIYSIIVPFLLKRKMQIFLFLFSSGIFSIVQGISLGLLFPFLRVLFYNEPSSLSSKSFFLDNFFHNVEKFLLTPKGFMSILKMGFIVLFLFFVKSIFGYLARFINYRIQEGVSKDIRDKLFSRILFLPLSFFKRKKTGELVSRFTHDTIYLRFALSEGFFVIYREFANLFVFLLVALWASWNLTLFSLVLIPPVVYVIYKIGNSIKRKAGRFQEQMGGIGSFLTEKISGIETVKAFTGEQKEIEDFRKKNTLFFRRKVRFENLIHLSPHLTEFLSAIIAVMILVFAGKLIFIDRSLSPDRFFVFLAASLSFLQPLKNLTSAWTNIQQGKAVLKRVHTIFIEKEEKRGGEIIFQNIKENIRYEGVYYSYNGEKEVLKDITFSIRKYERIALVGPSGSGKSTLVNILLGFYFPTKGKVFIDNIPIEQFYIPSLRKKISIVPQDVFLFSGTVLDNLLYGNPSAKKEDIWRAIENSALTEFISSLPDGLNTEIGERGVTISGGERQRIAIARAFLKNPDILIMDEATSQIDSDSEKKIQSALEKLQKGRTTIIIAHRLSTVLSSDRIIVLSNGKIVAQGKHNELLDSSSLYRKLYQLQFKPFPIGE